MDHFFPQLMNALTLQYCNIILYFLSSELSPCRLLPMHLLQVNQAVSDFSNERDKVVGQLREAEVAFT